MGKHRLSVRRDLRATADTQAAELGGAAPSRLNFIKLKHFFIVRVRSENIETTIFITNYDRIW